MEFRILGPLQAVSGGRPVCLRGQRLRLVLAALLLEPGRVLGVDRLSEVVWEDRPPSSARTQIAISISGLRRALREVAGDEDLIETVRPGYRLRAEAVRLDTATAEQLVARARDAASRGSAADAVALFGEALALWRGPVLAGMDSPIITAGGLRWEELRLTAVEESMEIELDRGRHHELVGELMALVAGNPLRERLRALLMTALSRSGRRVEALAAYHDGRRLLADDLGLEPGRALRELHEAILRDDPSVHREEALVRDARGVTHRARAPRPGCSLRTASIHAKPRR